MGVLTSLIKKELIQLKRNPFIPKLMVAYPVLIVLVMPWMTTMDVRNINVGVVDCDRSEVSGKMVHCIESSDYLILENLYSDYASALGSLEDGRLDVILEIPSGFGKSVMTPRMKQLNVSANGVNAMKGVLGSQYLVQSMMGCLKEMRASRGMPVPDETITVTNFYNPTLDYKVFMIPALLIMVLVMIGGFLPALNLVVEKENGTIEQINVSPVGKLTFTMSKLIPYWVICFIVLGVCMLLARLVYGLGVAGSVWAIFLASIPFIMIISGIGVSIANISDTMQQTMFLMLFVVLSFILLSGLMTPVESMPDWAQKLTLILPPTYLVEIMRGVYLKGATITDLWIDYAALAFFAILFCSIATFTYRKR